MQVLVSTFSGESYGDAFWSSVKSTLSSAGVSISFAPAFLSYRDPSQATTAVSTFTSLDGWFNWWSWPADNGDLLTTDTDIAYKNAIKAERSGPYIMGEWSIFGAFAHEPEYLRTRHRCLASSIQRTWRDE